MRIGYFTNLPEQGITAGTAVVGVSALSRSPSAKSFYSIVRELDLLHVTIRPGQHCQVVDLPDIGADVAAEHRRPSTAVGTHPAQKPWRGTVLAHDDSAAWDGSIAFSARPSVSVIRAHLARCYSEGLLWDDVPVLWHFAEGARVHWERADSLRPYDEAISDWMMQSAYANRIAA